MPSKFLKGSDELGSLYRALTFARDFIQFSNKDFHEGKSKKKILVYQEEEIDNCNLNFPMTTSESNLFIAIDKYFHEIYPHLKAEAEVQAKEVLELIKRNPL